MALNTFLDFSTTASSNVDVAGIGIQGTNAVQNFDNAFRQLMAILRRDLDNGMVFASKSANYTAVANDNNGFIRFSAAATLSLTAAATLGADWHVWVMADGGAVVIDPNSSETINGATTITIPDGATVLVICDGTNFRATEDYTRFVQATVDVASASTTNIGASASWNVRITGTTTITAFDTADEGTLRFVRMAGALTLTHNGTSLILPNGGQNITTAANDCFLARSLGSGNWLVMFYQKATPSSITRATAITASSQTSMDFTSIPAGVRKITIGFVGLSTNGTDPMIVQIGDSGGVETTGYLGSASNVVTTVSSANFTIGFGVQPSLIATNIIHGLMHLVNVSGNEWAASGTTARSDTASTSLMAGSKSLSDTLDRVRITTTGGTNTFDAGSVNIMWEF